MKNKKLFLALSIVLYVLCAAGITVAALYFAMSNAIYWLFLILGLVCLFGGLYLNYLREKDNPKRIDPVTKEKIKKPWYLRLNFLLLCGSFVLALLGGFAGQLCETSTYSVKVSDFTLTREMTYKYNNGVVNGKQYVIEEEEGRSTYGVTMYVPKFATAEKPAPTIFVIPGFTRTKATMAQYAIEFSRRGAVVFIIDPGCQGSTTAGGYTYDPDTGEAEMVSSTAGANGAEYLIQYVYNDTEDFPFVDRDRFGVVGHSAGGGNAITVASDFAGTSYETSIIKAVYNSGYIKTSAANKFKNLHCNAAMSYAYYDEGAYRYQTSTTSFEVIALRFLNEVSGSTSETITQFTLDTCVDQEFGDTSNGTYRVVHHEKTNHCFEMYDFESIANNIDFFSKTLHISSKIKSTNQVWYLKEGGTLISLVSGFIFFVSLAMVLIDNVPFFHKHVVTEKVERPKILDENGHEIRKAKNPADAFVFWFTMILTAIIACLDYIPLAYCSIVWFPEAASNTYTFVFPARMVNAILLWAAINGVIGLILFFGVNLGENGIRKLIEKKTGKKQDYTYWKLKPLRISLAGLGKTILLAAIVFGAYYGLIYLDYALFHCDFRFMLISASKIPARYWIVWLEYFPIIFLFYISNSIRVNCSIGMEGWSEWKVKLVGALANSLGLVFILVINYWCFFRTGSVYYGYMGDGSEVWLYVNMVFGLIPMMFILPILNRIFFNKTNQPYLGAIITCAIFIMMTLTASVAYIPL